MPVQYDGQYLGPKTNPVEREAEEQQFAKWLKESGSQAGVRRDEAERHVRGILEKILGKLDPHLGNPSDVGKKQAYQAAAYDMARSFMIPKGQDPEADADREAAIMLAHAMNPRSTDPRIYEKLNNYTKHFHNLGSLAAHVSREGYTGAGWTEREEKERGVTPSRAELSPGDLMHYQRRLDSHSLAEIHKANEEWLAKSRSQDPREADAGNRNLYYQAGKTINTHKDAQGEPYAFGLMGSKYPWHQGMNAVMDAMTSHASPIGNFVQKGVTQSEIAANWFMSKENPVDQAVTKYESDYLWGIPSPQGVPDLSPEERDAFVEARLKEARALGSHDYSTWAWAKYGTPPSYYWQGAANFANALADISTPVSVFSAKPLNYVMKTAAANTRIPLLTRYMGHIANKTAAGARAPLLPALKSESIQDLYPTAGMQGLATYGELKKPGFIQGFLPGQENRPDLKGFAPDEGVNDPSRSPSRGALMGQPQAVGIKGYVDQRDEETAAALKSATDHNKRHPESLSNVSFMNPGAVIGDRFGAEMSKPAQNTSPGWFNLFKNALISR